MESVKGKLYIGIDNDTLDGPASQVSGIWFKTITRGQALTVLQVVRP